MTDEDARARVPVLPSDCLLKKRTNAKLQKMINGNEIGKLHH
jgi:hypothetical protein